MERDQDLTRARELQIPWPKGSSCSSLWRNACSGHAHCAPVGTGCRVKDSFLATFVTNVDIAMLVQPPIDLTRRADPRCEFVYETPAQQILFDIASIYKFAYGNGIDVFMAVGPAQTDSLAMLYFMCRMRSTPELLIKDVYAKARDIVLNAHLSFLPKIAMLQALVGIVLEEKSQPSSRLVNKLMSATVKLLVTGAGIAVAVAIYNSHNKMAPVALLPSPPPPVQKGVGVGGYVAAAAGGTTALAAATGYMAKRFKKNHDQTPREFDPSVPPPPPPPPSNPLPEPRDRTKKQKKQEEKFLKDKKLNEEKPSIRGIITDDDDDA